MQANKIRGIFYETLGDRSNPPLILIMGLGAQLIQWPGFVLQGLVERGFYVVLFDNRDVGLSDYYEYLGTPDIAPILESKKKGLPVELPYTLADMAQDVIRLMDGLDIAQAHIAGISMGGMIAQIIAATYQTRVLTLTCLASTSGAYHLPPATPEVQSCLFSGGSSKPSSLEDYIKNRLYTHQVYNHPEDCSLDLARTLAIKSYQRAHYPAGVQRQLLAIMAADPRDTMLQKVAVRSLIIHGDYDPVFPLAHGENLAACLPNSQLEIIAKMGHGVPARCYNAIVNMIAKQLD